MSTKKKSAKKPAPATDNFIECYVRLPLEIVQQYSQLAVLAGVPMEHCMRIAIAFELMRNGVTRPG